MPARRKGRHHARLGKRREPGRDAGLSVASVPSAMTEKPSRSAARAIWAKMNRLHRRHRSGRIRADVVMREHVDVDHLERHAQIARHASGVLKLELRLKRRVHQISPHRAARIDRSREQVGGVDPARERHGEARRAREETAQGSTPRRWPSPTDRSSVAIARSPSFSIPDLLQLAQRNAVKTPPACKTPRAGTRRRSTPARQAPKTEAACGSAAAICTARSSTHAGEARRPAATQALCAFPR